MKTANFYCSKSHIKKGNKFCPFTNPVALAIINRLKPEHTVQVLQSTVRFYDSTDKEVHRNFLPKPVREHLANFNKTGTNKPLKFKLVIPDNLIQ